MGGGMGGRQGGGGMGMGGGMGDMDDMDGGMGGGMMGRQGGMGGRQGGMGGGKHCYCFFWGGGGGLLPLYHLSETAFFKSHFSETSAEKNAKPTISLVLLKSESSSSFPSVSVQAGLCLTLSETLKTSFL